MYSGAFQMLDNGWYYNRLNAEAKNPAVSIKLDIFKFCKNVNTNLAKFFVLISNAVNFDSYNSHKPKLMSPK